MNERLESAARVLLLTRPERRNRPLVEQLSAFGVVFSFTSECNEAEKILAMKPSDGWVVLTDVRLSDGTWRDIWNYVTRAHIRAEIVVCADKYDKELWLEASTLGIFDLLAPPYIQERTRRVIEAAAASCDRYPYSMDAEPPSS